MRTKKIIIVERENNSVVAVYTNDPNLDIDSGTVRRNELPKDAEVVNAAPNTMEECGCCNCFHRPEFSGDCRDDDERFVNCT